MKDKLGDWVGSDESAAVASGQTTSGSSLEEAETALISLGYKPQEASKAVVAAAKILEESGQVADSENLIRTALRNMF